jgi:hypothetical protein
MGSSPHTAWQGNFVGFGAMTMYPARPAAVPAGGAAARQAVTQAAHQRGWPAPETENWNVLAKAQLEAMTGLFPGWRIWLDARGWHARRRTDGFVEQFRPGAPAFHVQASSAVDLAAQLCWQRAADEHAPRGCEAARR